tara:strand:+ start:178 stop:573 length:396 start_codon:yes stop_codon:yes gene_type:complete
MNNQNFLNKLSFIERMVLNKRGQGLSVNAIILIVLGVVVLAVLIFGFTVGFGKILPFISSNNVDVIVNSCDTACTTNSVYGFCTQERTLKAEDLPEDLKATCYKLSTDHTKYGVDECPALKAECDKLDNSQ